MSDSILTDLLAALDVIVIEQLADNHYALIGSAPGWFLWLYPEAAKNPAQLDFHQTSPFLENFLVDADLFWRAGRGGQLKSGSWEEKGPTGKEDHLEATALCLGTRRILLIELLGVAHEERRRMLQLVRERTLLQQQLFKEIQKKEILLHCIAHDLVSLLMGVKVSHSFLSAESLSPTGKDYLLMGQRQQAQQEKMIQEIVQAFAAEMESLGAFELDPAKVPDLLKCVKQSLHDLSGTAMLHKINLQLDPVTDQTIDWSVSAERSRLQRVIANLIENALLVGPPFSVVNVALTAEPEFATLTVQDEGPGIASELASTLFQKFSHAKSGHVGFGLYFCRMMVERWGGTIGYRPNDRHGSTFWIRLPRVLSNELIKK